METCAGPFPFYQKIKALDEKSLQAQYGSWREKVLLNKRQHPFASVPQKGVITPEALFNAAKTYTDEDTVIVTDVGQHQMWAAQFFPLAAPAASLLPAVWEPWGMAFRQLWEPRWAAPNARLSSLREMAAFS